MEPVVSLDARVRGRHAERAVAGLDDDAWVVVVHRSLETTYAAYRAHEVRSTPPDDELGEGLDPTAGVAVSAWHVDGDEPPPPGPTVAVGPDGVIGSLAFDDLEPREATRSGPFPPTTSPSGTTRGSGGVVGLPPPPPPPGTADPPVRPDSGQESAPPRPLPTSSPGPTRSWLRKGSDAIRSWWPRGSDEVRGASTEASSSPPDDLGLDATQPVDDDRPSAAGEPAQPPGTGDLTAHPRVQAPEQVTGDTTFELEVGIGDEPQPGTQDDPVDVPPMRIVDPGSGVDIEIQVVAPDFELPAGGRRFLHVRADDPTSAAATVPLAAPAVDEARRLTVRVDYVHRGMPIGQAWREVVVTPTDERVETTVDSGSAAMTVSDPAGWADLTVMISTGDEPGMLTWSFFTSHDVATPEQAQRSLDAADAEAFAHEQVLRLGRSAGSELEGAELHGVGRIVADVMPPEFWRSLEAVAEAVDGPPSLFLVTADPWIPWELASTGPDYLSPEVVDPDVPGFLGAQFRVARWLEQRAYGQVLRPDHPPIDRHGIARLCLVIGDYLAENGQRPLPAAIEEGQQLAERYPHVWRSATSADLDEVLGDRIRERGKSLQVDALHLACHGRITDDTRASGIVLSDDLNNTLNSTTIRGTTLARTRHPFVFLNACQVGQATTSPGGYGGMAGAFVREGASGFVAPLWEVDDRLAQQAALDFYTDTLDEGLPVAEAMRRFRAKFREGESSRLAYVYYGHPGLQLTSGDGPGASDGPADTDRPADVTEPIA